MGIQLEGGEKGTLPKAKEAAAAIDKERVRIFILHEEPKPRPLQLWP